MTHLEVLWAPWRNTFLTQRKAPRCIFCAAKRATDTRRHYVVAKGAQSFAMLNLYPYNNGHLMVAPTRHVGELESLTAGEWADMRRLTQRLMRRLRAELHPDGFNVGMNVGRVAGAGIPGHLHLHLVPRWRGDTNFMPIIGKTKVMSQSLDELYTVLTT